MTMTKHDQNALMRECVCAECGMDLTMYVDRSSGDADLVLGCSQDKSHAGYKRLESVTEIVRREGGPAFLNIERRSSITGAEALNVIGARLMEQKGLSFAQAKAALIHAKGLDLDPFLAEIGFLTFKTKDDPNDKNVTVMIAEKGWAKLAHRFEPEEFLGSPTLTRMTPEEMVDYGWDADDVAYTATGRKRSWPADHATSVSARYSKKEIQTAKSRSTPGGEDPHSHCRTRAARRWYEQNYPNASQFVSVTLEATAAQVIDAETSSPLPMGEPLADPESRHLRDRCPEHDKPWEAGTHGKYHRTERGEPLCSLGPMLTAKTQNAASKQDLTVKDVNDWAKARPEFGATLSQLHDDQRIAILGMLEQGGLPSEEPRPEPPGPPINDDDPASDLYGEPGDGATEGE